MAYNTGNAVPSSDPRDRSDNTVNLDKAVNSLTDLTFVDRKGQVRDTYAGIIAKAAKVLATGQIYSSTAAGIASGVQWFSIIAGSTDESFILYENVAGVATERKRFPSAASVSEMYDLIAPIIGSGDTAFEFNDTSGFNLLKILATGTIEMLNASLRNGDNGGLDILDEFGFVTGRLGDMSSYINGLTFEVDLEGDGLYFTDRHGFIVGKMDSKGAFFGPAPTKDKITLPPTVAQLDHQQRTDHIQVIEYGQSLSVGHSAVPPISVTQPYNNLMIASGVRIVQGEADYDPTAYVPLVEAEGPATNQGETPVSGICNGVTRRAVAAGEDPARWVMLGMSPGRSGWAVERLSPKPLGTTGHYEKVIEMIRDCAALSKSLGKTYSVWAYSWTQGESNYQSGWETSPYQYMQYQLELFDRMTVDVMSVTGQVFRPYLFTYQVAAHRKYNRDDMPIALTQWRISRQRPDVVIASPCYIFKTAADELHLTNEASWLLGEYTSRAMHSTMVKRAGKWRPLEPVSVDWGVNQIDVKFHVPSGKLVLDNALADTVVNSGFDIREAGAVATTIIQSVALVGIDTVRITLTREAAAGAVLTYARGRPGDPVASGPTRGARGNLRDTHGDHDKATSPNGVQYALHNACVMFEYSRNTGF